MDKAHIQHAVRLVQNEHFHMRQADLALVNQIIQTSGGGYQNVNAALQLFDLGNCGDSAEYDGASYRSMGTVFFEIFCNLQRQFPRRGENQ